MGFAPLSPIQGRGTPGLHKPGMKGFMIKGFMMKGLRTGENETKGSGSMVAGTQ